MAANTLSYRVELDTSEVSNRLHEVRSQVSSVMGGPSDFQGAMSGLAGFGNAAAASYAMMRGGLEKSFGGIASYTDPAMAFESHYGMVRAESTLSQELGAYLKGPAGVAGMTPPGVGAGEYSALLQRNLAGRAEDTAAGFMRGALPVAAGFAGWSAATKAVGAAKWLATGSGLGLLSGIGVGIAGSWAAEKLVSGGIERGDKIVNEVNELGNIATAGRGFSTEQSQQFGKGFRDMASRMNVSTNELGDMISGIRQAGMMPTTRDVNQSLSQFEGMAKDIRDIAVGMQTSLGRATQYLKSVESLGLGRGAGGVFAAAGTAEGLGTSLSGLIGYAGQGQAIGRAAQIGGGFGGALFMQSAFAGAAGMGALTGEERQMSGGALGLGRAFGMNALQNAMGPWGQVQMMAMMGPSGARGLPGGAMATLDQAAGNIMGGGDPIANFVEFTTNRNRMTNQLGAKGVRLMQAHSIQDQAQMLMDLSPGLTQQRALQFSGMQSGLNENQSRVMAKFIMGGFKDSGGPSAQVQGMPAVFGSGRVAEMAIRAGTDSAARQVAANAEEANKGPIDRATEWIGDQWAGMRLKMQRDAQDHIEERNAAAGVFNPSREAISATSDMMRTGRGPLTMTLADIRNYGSSGAQLQSVLSFAGAKPGGDTGAIVATGTYGVQGMREGMQRLAKNIHDSSRLNASQQQEKDAASLQIGMAIDKGDWNSKKTAENLTANMNKVTKGGGQAYVAAANLKHDVGEIIKRSGNKDWIKEYEKKGLSGSSGAAMIKTIDTFMQGHGAKGFSLARTLEDQSAAGMAAIAQSLDVGASGLARRGLGMGSVDPTKEEIQKEAERAAINTGLFPTPFPPGGVKITDEMRESARARLIQQAGKDAKSDEHVSRAERVIGQKSWADYIQARDAMFHKPFRDAREKLTKDPEFRKMDKDKQAALINAVGEGAKIAAAAKHGDQYKKLEKKVVEDAQRSNDPGASATARKLISSVSKDAQGKDLQKDMSAFLGINQAKQHSDKKKDAHRKSGGKTVAFQSQAESFQGQLVSALRKTALTLDSVKQAMQSISRGGAKPPSGGQ